MSGHPSLPVRPVRVTGSRLRSSLLAGLGFVLGFSLVATWLPELPLDAGERPAAQWMPAFEVPGDASFFTYSASNERSHLALFHDFGDSISNARDADVLFLGNSRMLLGLREEAILAAAAEHGLRVFSLAVGHAEGVAFARRLVAIHDLRPKVVVAVGGPSFYSDELSEWGGAVAEMSRWDAWKEWAELGWRWRWQRLVHSVLPRIDWFGVPLTTDWIIFRSATTGWWQPAAEPGGRAAVGFANELASYDGLLPVARALKSELDDRDVLLVLSAVPYLRTQTGHLPFLSESLGVPSVLPAVEELTTNDGSHLDRASGLRYARAFWQELLSVPAVQAKLGVQLDSPPTPQVDRAALSRVRRAVVDMRAMLEEYYGGSEILRRTWYLQPDDVRYQRGVEFIADKLARSLVWRDRFVIGTIGSSVTAGYDNCRYDTYQQQLERLMQPVWQAAGVEFEVRNTGQGGNWGDSFVNQVWCLRTLVGDDVDMTHYSWTYFESGRAEEEIELHHELFYRWSLLMERGAAPQLIYANDCSRLSQRDIALLDAYGPFGANILCMERGIRGAGFPGKEWGAIGDKVHDTTREGEGSDVSAERRASLGVVFRNWHPGPLLFQTTADAVAYHLSDALLLALDLVGEEAYPSVRWPRRPRLQTAAKLPRPSACPEAWCADRVPRCTNYEKPVFGRQFFPRLDAKAEHNRHRGRVSESDAKWEMREAVIGAGRMPQEERDRPECVHPNNGRGFVAPASQQAGWLTFEMRDLEVGRIAVCCAAKRCGKMMLEAGVEFLLDNTPPAAPPQPMQNEKCVVVQEAFAEAKRRPRTVHLGIRVAKRAKPLPAITHVWGL